MEIEKPAENEDELQNIFPWELTEILRHKRQHNRCSKISISQVFQESYSQ